MDSIVYGICADGPAQGLVVECIPGDRDLQVTLLDTHEVCIYKLAGWGTTEVSHRIALFKFIKSRLKGR